MTPDFAIGNCWSRSPCCVRVDAEANKIAKNVSAHLVLKISPNPGKFRYQGVLELRGARPATIVVEAYASIVPQLEWEERPRAPWYLTPKEVRKYELVLISRRKKENIYHPLTLVNVTNNTTFQQGETKEIAEDAPWLAERTQCTLMIRADNKEGRARTEFLVRAGTGEIGRLPLEWMVKTPIDVVPRVITFEQCESKHRVKISSTHRGNLQILHIRAGAAYSVRVDKPSEPGVVSILVARAAMACGNESKTMEKIELETNLGTAEILVYTPRQQTEKKS